MHDPGQRFNTDTIFWFSHGTNVKAASDDAGDRTVADF